MKINNFIVVGIFISLVFTSLVSSWGISTFNNSLSSENISLNYNVITRYLAVPTSVTSLRSGQFILSYSAGTNSQGLSIKSPYWTSALNVSLNSYYTFDENTGTTANDALWLCNNSFLFATIPWVTGRVNYAADIPGNGAYMGCGAKKTYNYTGATDFSINTWLNWTPHGESVIQPILYGDPGTYGWYLFTQTSNKTGFGKLGTSEVNGTDDIKQYQGKWTMYTLVYNGTGVYFYYNGIGDSGNPHTYSATFDATSSYNIGSYGSYKLNASIDELGFWNRTLTPSEINALYGSAVPDGNFSLNVGGTNINSILLLNATDNNFTASTTISGLQTYINNYLTTCTAIAGTCRVPFIFNLTGTGKIGYSGLSFSNEGFAENGQTYNSSVQSLSNNPFYINLTYDSTYYTSSSAILVYNNTNYNGIKTISGNDVIFSINTIAPVVSGSTNIPFYWKVSLTNSSSTTIYNSTMYNQTVTNILIDDCSSYRFLLVNFTNYDQDTLERISSSNYSITIKLGDAMLTSYAQYSGNKSNAPSMAVCINNETTQTYRMDLVMQSTSTDRFIQFYNMQNYTLTNSTARQNIRLYNLLTANGQTFRIDIKDSNYLPLRDALVEINRQYISNGNYLAVEIPLTDSQGSTVGHFILNNQLYNIYIKKNGRLLASFTDQRLYCNPSLTECVLTYNLAGNNVLPTPVEGNLGVYFYNQQYNKTTQVYSFDFSTVSGDEKTIKIEGILLDNNLNTSVCSQSVTSSSGTLTCTISTDYTNSTILIKATVNGLTLFTDRVNTGFSRGNVLTQSRYIIAALLIPALALMAAGSASIAVVAFVIGLGICVLLFLVDAQSIFGTGSFIVFFAIAAIIVIIKIVNGGVKNG